MAGSVRLRFFIRKLAVFAALVIWVAAACHSVSAQSERTFIIRLFDSQTGQPVAPIPGDNGISITVNENTASPHLTARVNKDGVWEAHVGPDVEKVQIDTPAGPDGFGYVFCDCSKFHPATLPSYSVAEILKTGVEASNKCSKRFTQAKPGEIVFFVRRPNWHEKLPI
jgi:hypothetical protein